MRKKILAGAMLATMIFSLTACGTDKGNTDNSQEYSATNENKTDEKTFGEVLDAYAAYYEDEINADGKSDIGVTITLDKYGMPVMIVAESSKNSVNSTIYVVENGKVKAIKDFRNNYDAIYTYMDGIIRVEVKNKEYEYYQLAGSELKSLDSIISDVYQKWDTKAATGVKRIAGNEMNYKLLNTELGVYVGSGTYHLGADFADYTGGYAQVSSDISELYDLIYKEIYSDDVKFTGYNSLLELDYCDDGDDGHVFSSPLLSFGEMYELSASDFQYYLRALKEKGGMDWKEFYVWHWNLFADEDKDIMDTDELDMEDVIQRDISLVDEINIFTEQKDSSSLDKYKKAVVLYAFYNEQYDLLDTIELTKSMTPTEVLDVLNIHGEFYNYATREEGQALSEVVGFDNFYGSDGSQTDKAKLLKEYIDNNVIKSTKKETLKALYDFVQNSTEVLASLK